MPLLQTKYFGAVEYDEDAVVAFPGGLPGFEQQKQFLLIRQPVNAPLVFLQSVADPEVCFVTAPAETVEPGYTPRLTPEDLESLGLGADPPGGGLLSLAIVSFREGELPTANLRAPVVVHVRARRAVQACAQGERWSLRHPLAGTGGAPCS